MKKILLITVITVLSAINIFASTDGVVLLIEPTSRSIAIGNSGVTLTDTSEGFFYNPATITSVLRKDIKFGIDLRKDQLITPAISFAMPLIRNKLYLGFSQLFLASSDQDFHTNLAHDIILRDDFNTHLYFSVGLAVGSFSGFSFGASIKTLMEFNRNDERVENLIDLGFLYQFKNIPLTLGLSMQNISIHLYSKHENDNVPYIFRFGADYSVIKLFNHLVDLYFNLVKAEEDDYKISTGAEYTIKDTFIFRLGYYLKDSYPRFGFGYKNTSVDLSINIDISYQYTPESKSILKLTFGIGF